jgi:hypothetical protein
MELEARQRLAVTFSDPNRSWLPIPHIGIKRRWCEDIPLR